MTRLRILLVEDDSNWRYITYTRVQQAMEHLALEGTVQPYSTFEEACQALENGDEPWHLIITDIGLGSQHSNQKLGLHLVKRAQEQLIPCIVVSGTPVVTRGDVRDLLKELGACDFFSKQNFSIEKFVEAVEHVLRAPIQKQLKDGEKPSLFLGLPQLRQQIIDSFDENELRSLCFDLDIEYENLPALTKVNRVEALITYCQRHQMLSLLLAQCREYRPHLVWS